MTNINPDIIDLIMKWIYTTSGIFALIFVMAIYLEYEQKQRFEKDKNV